LRGISQQALCGRACLLVNANPCMLGRALKIKSWLWKFKNYVCFLLVEKYIGEEWDKDIKRGRALISPLLSCSSPLPLCPFSPHSPPHFPPRSHGWPFLLSSSTLLLSLNLSIWKKKEEGLSQALLLRCFHLSFLTGQYHIAQEGWVWSVHLQPQLLRGEDYLSSAV